MASNKDRQPRPVRLLGYLGKYWYLYLFSIIMLLVSVASNAYIPVVIQKIIDDVIVGGAVGLLMRLLITLAALGIGHAITNYAKEYTADCVGVRLGGDLRRDLFEHIQSLSIGFFNENNTGELMARVKDDVDKVWFVMGFGGILAVECVIHTAVTLFCMFRISPLLTVLPIIVMAIMAIVAVKMERQLDKCYGEISEENAELTTVAQENLSGVRTVKAFAREQFELDKFNSHNKRYYDLNMKMAGILVKYDPFYHVAGAALVLLIVLAGGVMVIFGYDAMTLGKLAAYIEYANGAIWPMQCLAWLSNEIASAVASQRKIKRIFAQAPDISAPEDAVRLTDVKGALSFENVSFGIDGTEILRDVSFELAPGGTVGIMGMTGSGKTTVINLIERFYDADSGKISLDGHDIRTLDLATLRESVSVVMQDVFLFSDSISENISLGSRGSMDAVRMHKAARQANASEFIDKLSNEYDTIIGERGVGLSGGQKQRLSIARAIAKHAPILILDDATSALDMETEYEIQHELNAMTDVSKIIVAHRISAVKNADEIIILKDGAVAERGSHRELMAKRGLYFDTYVAQYNTEEDMVS